MQYILTEEEYRHMSGEAEQARLLRQQAYKLKQLLDLLGEDRFPGEAVKIIGVMGVM